MTALYRCDGPGCARMLGRNEPRLSITKHPPEMPQPDEETGEYPMMEFWGDGDNHFCSDSCLAAWAMDRAIS